MLLCLWGIHWHKFKLIYRAKREGKHAFTAFWYSNWPHSVFLSVPYASRDTRSYILAHKSIRSISYHVFCFKRNYTRTEASWAVGVLSNLIKPDNLSPTIWWPSSPPRMCSQQTRDIDPMLDQHWVDIVFAGLFAGSVELRGCVDWAINKPTLHVHCTYSS